MIAYDCIMKSINSRNISVRIFATENGKEPFTKWINSIKDNRVSDRIDQRLNRVKKGNKGDYKDLGKNLCELRIHLGPGYRIYFTELDSDNILILFGGNKSTQMFDIIQSRNYLTEYNQRFAGYNNGTV